MKISFHFIYFQQRRARIYRYDTNNGDEEPEFKERGTGTVKILQHKQTGMYRILMRREKTFKICANHYSKYLL